MNLKREAVWLAMCAVPAVAFCWMANDYGYSPVPFFTLAFLSNQLGRSTADSLSQRLPTIKESLRAGSIGPS
jgi:hypothetical protein